MQIIINQKSLLQELSIVQGACEKKNTIPILSYVLLEAAGDSVTISATDLDVGMQAKAQAEVLQPGAMVLPCKKLFDIVRSLPGGEIKVLSEDETHCRIVAGSSKFKLHGSAKEHYPSLPFEDGLPGISFPGDTLAKLVSRVAFAITQEESRYALGGALFEVSEDNALMVATDGHRLALAKAAIEGGVPSKVIIPRKALAEIPKLAGEKITYSLSDDEKNRNHIEFAADGRRLATRLLTGQFPNYDMVIPKQNDKVITLDVEVFAQAMRRTLLLADERSRAVNIEVRDGILSLTASATDLGEARAQIQLEGAPEISLRLNGVYVMDFLNAVGTERFEMHVKDEQTPVLFRPVGDEGYLYVVMPLRMP